MKQLSRTGSWTTGVTIQKGTISGDYKMQSFDSTSLVGPYSEDKKNCKTFLKTKATLVAQWLRIHLPMQETWVRALVQEDPTCRGAIKPLRHNYWACALEPVSHNYWAHVPQLLKPARLEPVLCNERSHCNEKPAHHNEE